MSIEISKCLERNHQFMRKIIENITHPYIVAVWCDALLQIVEAGPKQCMFQLFEAYAVLYGQCFNYMKQYRDHASNT